MEKRVLVKIMLGLGIMFLLLFNSSLWCVFTDSELFWYDPRVVLASLVLTGIICLIIFPLFLFIKVIIGLYNDAVETIIDYTEEVKNDNKTKDVANENKN